MHLMCALKLAHEVCSHRVVVVVVVVSVVFFAVRVQSIHVSYKILLKIVRFNKYTRQR